MMRHGSQAPAGGEVKRVTKTDTLLAHIKGLGRDRYDNPIGIRTGALSDATGVNKNSIQMLLDPHVKSGQLVVCKITGPNGREEREYRAGPGVPPPDFVPLKIKRGPGSLVARTAPAPTWPDLSTPRPPRPTLEDIQTPTLTTTKTQPEVVAPHVAETPAAGGLPTPEAAPAVAAQATPKPSTGAALKEEPATRKASAGDDLRIGINAEGTLVIALDDDQLELNIYQALKLGDFMHATQGVWRPLGATLEFTGLRGFLRRSGGMIG